MITGKTNKPKVNPPARIESPKPNLFTNNAIPKRPNTIDGTPARLFVICFIIFFGLHLHIHSYIAANTPTGKAKIILVKTKQSVPIIAGKTPLGHSVFRHFTNEFPTDGTNSFYHNKSEYYK
jgi:hypothetical protein